jgi:predicted GTPase
MVGMANPAAVNCLEKWWILEKDGDSTNCNIWGQICEQWAYIRGECNIEVASKLESGWNTLYEKYTKNKSNSYKKVLLSALNTQISDLQKKEAWNDKATLYAHLLYLIDNTSNSIK